eukprot:scaffold39685_cov64-Phaeocystis_antarctica.AAC.4
MHGRVRVGRRHGSLITVYGLRTRLPSRGREAEHRREHVDPSASRSAARFHSNFVGGAKFEGVLIERSSSHPGTLHQYLSNVAKPSQTDYVPRVGAIASHTLHDLRIMFANALLPLAPLLLRPARDLASPPDRPYYPHEPLLRPRARRHVRCPAASRSTLPLEAWALVRRRTARDTPACAPLGSRGAVPRSWDWSRSGTTCGMA